MATTLKLFSLEGKGLKLDTAEDLEAHIADLRANDVEEVKVLGNTFGIGACKLLGEVLAEKKNLQKMAPFVDGWHLMAYDYAGSWSGKTGHQSNLYRSKSNPAATQYDTETAVNYYLSQGINPSKVLLGVPLYGRSFARTDGLGKPYSGIGKGSIEAGVYHYKALPAPGAEERWDAEAVAAWSYDKKTRELVTYDNQNSVKRKADYLVKKRLGGAVFWESAGDRAGDRSLVRTVSKAMGAMDQTKNWLSYPASKYANIRKGMPGQ
ncbi:hypothetical protein BN1708_016352, partial [Verticillium longisporum]